MKKFMIVMGSALLAVGIYAWLNSQSSEGKVDLSNSKETDDISDVFTTKEIQDAKDVVIEGFVSHEDCTLTDLWYSNEYLGEEEKGANQIILVSNYDTGRNPHLSLNKNSTYPMWTWKLERKDKDSKWKLIDGGY